MKKVRSKKIIALLFSLLVFFVIGVSLALFSYVQRLKNDVLAGHLRDAEVNARVFEDQLTQSLTLAGLTLLTLPENVDFPKQGLPAAQAPIGSKLENIQRHLMFLRSLSIADAKGEILASSNPASGTSSCLICSRSSHGLIQ